MRGLAQQKQGAWWFFGTYGGLNFNYTPPRAVGLPVAMSYAASISDAQGRHQFTASGSVFYDRDFNLVNVPGLNYLDWQILIAQNPGDAQQYYVFRVGRTFPPGIPWAFQYYLVDMRLRGGRGDVQQPIRLLRSVLNPRLSLLQHANNRDSWLAAVNASRDSLLTYRLQPTGLNQPLIAPLGGRLRSWMGVMKNAPDSRTLAIADSLAGVRLFAFDRLSGTAAYRYTLQIPVRDTPQRQTFAFSVAFSSDGTKLYVGESDKVNVVSPVAEANIYQFDLTQPDSTAIQASRTLIGTVPSLTPVAGQSTIRDMQLGIDGKLYIQLGRSTLSVIDCPNALGTACGLRLHSIPQIGAGGANLPSLNQTLFVNAGTFQVQASDTVACAGDTIRLAAYGAGADRFTWSVVSSTGGPTATPAPVTAPGVVPPVGTTVYAVSAASACDSYSGQVRVRVRPRPVVTLGGASVPSRLCLNGGVRMLQGGQPLGGYYQGAGIIDSLSGLFDPLVAGVGPTTVRYVYQAPGGCAGSAEVVITVDNCLGTNADAAAVPALLLWPNPARESVQLRAASSGEVELLDPLGRVVDRTTVSAGQTLTWSLRGLPAGLYGVRCGATVRRLVVDP